MNANTQDLQQGATHFWNKILWTDETKINLYQNDVPIKSMEG